MVCEESLLSSLLLYGSCLFVDVCMCMMYGVCEGSETGYFGGGEGRRPDLDIEP